MSNNRGMISLARKIALKDISKYMKKMKKAKWAGTMLRKSKAITKLNKKLGI